MLKGVITNHQRLFSRLVDLSDIFKTNFTVDFDTEKLSLYMRDETGRKFAEMVIQVPAESFSRYDIISNPTFSTAELDREEMWNLLQPFLNPKDDVLLVLVMSGWLTLSTRTTFCKLRLTSAPHLHQDLYQRGMRPRSISVRVVDVLPFFTLAYRNADFVYFVNNPETVVFYGGEGKSHTIHKEEAEPLIGEDAVDFFQPSEGLMYMMDQEQDFSVTYNDDGSGAGILFLCPGYSVFFET